MAMDNRSIAAFIETNKSKQIMNEFCYNVCPVKVRAKKKRNNTKYSYKKKGAIRGRRWESKAASHAEL